MKYLKLFALLMFVSSICIGHNHLFDSYEKQMNQIYGYNGPATQQAAQSEFNILFKKYGREKINRRISFSANDWTTDVLKFIRVDYDNLPILNQTDLKGDHLKVIGFTKAGELLQFIEDKHESVKIERPGGWRVRSYGDWYQVKTLEGEYGWIFAKPFGSNYAFASAVEKNIPKPIDNSNKTDFPTGDIIIAALIFFGIIAIFSSFGSSTTASTNYGSGAYSPSPYYSESNSDINSASDAIESESESEKQKRIIGHAGLGKRVNPKTGTIQEKGLFGWIDTNKKIDAETGNFQKEGFFGLNDTETRIDQESGIIQKESLFGHTDTDTKVNPETGIIQKEGLFGWYDTDKRINPETGRSQHEGLFGWVDD